MKLAMNTITTISASSTWFQVKEGAGG